MKFILEYKEFYKEGDIVYIHYWYNYMITPVKIIGKTKKGESPSGFKISHDVEGSVIRNAPDEIIKSSKILDKTENPS